MLNPRILNAALDALGERATPVYQARQLDDGRIELWLCNRTEPIYWRPPKRRRRRRSTPHREEP